MLIPPEIESLIKRLNLELETIEREATEGLNIVQPILFSFPDNIRLIQFVALFNNSLLFVEISRRRIKAFCDRLDAPDIAMAEIQEAGEDLGVLLGQCLEAKIRSKRILNILKNLS
jgi:hypothetical protein